MVVLQHFTAHRFTIKCNIVECELNTVLLATLFCAMDI